MIKHVFAVGDSFTYGDELPESLRLTSTYGNLIANKMLALTFSNLSQCGASMEGILLQILFVLKEIRSKGYNINECYLLTGLTSPYRKLFIPNDCQLFNLKMTQQSIMLNDARHSADGTVALSKEIVKCQGVNQWLVEYILTLINISNLLSRIKLPGLLINVWSESFLDILGENLYKVQINDLMTTFNLSDQIFPKYPDSLISMTNYSFDSINSYPGGHPDEHIHNLWADLIWNHIQTLRQ